MTRIGCRGRCTVAGAGRSSAHLRRVAVAGVLMLSAGLAYGVGIQGTMSNFDVFNETGFNAYGAELDLDGVHSADVTKTYPCHFSNMTISDYINGSSFGTKIVFTGYNFLPVGYIAPTTGITTNGHYAVNQVGCEHFGFMVRTQPTATKYFWLDQTAHPIGTAPMSIPGPTWTYVPPAGAQPAIMQAVLAPPPPPPAVLYPDAVWVKTFVTELQRPVDLGELISGPEDVVVSPEKASEVEAEWELLPGDTKLQEPDIQLADADQCVIRRYEFYQYTGTYDEMHLPNYQYTGGPLLADAPLGQFIAANMVAANLADLPAPADVPEPSALLVLAGGLGVAGLMGRRRRGSAE